MEGKKRGGKIEGFRGMGNWNSERESEGKRRVSGERVKVKHGAEEKGKMVKYGKRAGGGYLTQGGLRQRLSQPKPLWPKKQKLV